MPCQTRKTYAMPSQAKILWWCEKGREGCGHPPAETCKGLALPSLAFVLASLIDAIKAICSAQLATAKTLSVAEGVLLAKTDNFTCHEDLSVASGLSNLDWKIEQRSDKMIERVIHLIQKGHKPTKRQMAQEDASIYKLLKEWDKLILKDTFLFRYSNLNGEKVSQLVPPVIYRELALTGYHDDAGHQGRNRTAYLIKSRFYWPGMDRDIELEVQNC